MFLRLVAVACFTVYSISLTHWEDAVPFVEDTLMLLGWALIGLCVMGRVWAGSHICGFKESALLTDGPYSISRNPLYFFSFLGGLGITFIMGSLLFSFLFIVFFFSYYWPVIRFEEKKLIKRHGADYERYCEEVPRFWPKPSLYNEAPTHVISSSAFLKHLGDVFGFIVAGGIVEFIKEMHIIGVLPTFLKLF